MVICKLALQAFRNIAQLQLTFHPRWNIFVGSNAQGKTNLLEAIVLLSFGRSFRVSDYRDLIQWGKNEGEIRAQMDNGIGTEERQIILGEERKKVFRNGKNVRPDQFATLPLVLFSPESILLLKESPGERRDYVDRLIGQCSPRYAKSLIRYKRVLLQRNKILKDENIVFGEKGKLLAVWNEPLVAEGRVLIQERRNWLQIFARFLEKNYDEIAGASFQAQFNYQPNVGEEEFPEQLFASREEELARGITVVGPHRDDFIGSLGEKPLRLFGSQGECRTFTLAMKLAEIAVLEQTFERSPLLLLDDVLSELDPKRSEYFFRYLERFKGQVFATATHLELFPSGSLKEYSGWEVTAGKIDCFGG